MSSIESVETGIRSDYTRSLTDEEPPREIGVGADIEATTYEIEDPKSAKDFATLREVQGEVVLRRGLGHAVVGSVFHFPERDPDGGWVVGTKELSEQ